MAYTIDTPILTAFDIALTNMASGDVVKATQWNTVVGNLVDQGNGNAALIAELMADVDSLRLGDLGTGDMTKARYDLNDDGIVDKAATLYAGGLPYVPSDFAEAVHDHTDVISISRGGTGKTTAAESRTALGINLSSLASQTWVTTQLNTGLATKQNYAPSRTTIPDSTVGEDGDEFFIY